jgi:bifunctional non-homologous end joining protein LigD
MNANSGKLITTGKKAIAPTRVSPMLCTLLREPFTNDQYIYELKLDGYRIVSFVNNSKVHMASRSGLDYTAKYPPIAAALKKLGTNLVVDGEVAVLNDKGQPDFDALQKFNGHSTAIVYFIFDLLWINGYDTRQLPLLDRKLILKDLLKDNAVLRYTEHFGDGLALYNAVEKLGMEGIVAKKKDSVYTENDRSSNWYKIPTAIRQEFVIGGWAESNKSRSFKSLLFGAYNKAGKFEWIGRSGGGYKEKEMPAILNRLKKLEINESPFVNKILDTKGAIIHYVKPQLVANFSFAAWTKSGRIRKPATFLGFRKDKKAEQVVREIPRVLKQ